MTSGNISSRLDSSSDEEDDYPIYSRVAEALAANRLKAARENAARRLNRELGATTSSSNGKKPERKKKRKGRTDCDEDDNIICISPEQKKESLSLVTVYGLYEGKSHVLSFNISRTEPLNVLRNYLAQQLDAPACSVRLSLHGKLLNGYESLEQIEAGKTDCIGMPSFGLKSVRLVSIVTPQKIATILARMSSVEQFEVDELIKEALQNTFKLKFVLQKRPPVILDVDYPNDNIPYMSYMSNYKSQHFTNTAEFSAVIGELCDRLKTDSSKLAVFFDGERICETDTPSSLGMESGDAVDVIIKD
ncbi:hypothetical protein D918_01361 [Trichuris suis]|nr:hypothetical protein D918_01361 [Trichuris suis]